MTKPDDAEQSTKRQRQEVTFKNHSKLPHLPVESQTRQCKFLIHRYRNLHRPLSPAEREDSIQKRQRPAEVNTVLVIASGDSRIEISTLKDDQNALQTSKVNELLNMDKLV